MALGKNCDNKCNELQYLKAKRLAGPIAWRIACLALSVAFYFGPGAARAQDALPTGGNVAAGIARISGTGSGSMLIDQSSSAAIINWHSFSIGSGNEVNFANGNGATLNRVTGGSISNINGLLSATGSVYLLNPNGVIIGKDGVVNVGGSFVGTTLNITDDDFLNGGDTGFAGSSAASIVNYGRIGALGGDVALVAAKVENHGSIDAPGGTAALVAGYDVLMRDAALADGKFMVRVGGDGTSVTNTGAIAAAEAELRANGGNVLALAGNAGGSIRATGVANTGGRVFLTAPGGRVNVTSKVRARRSASAGSAGGAVYINADFIRHAGEIDITGIDGDGGLALLEGRDIALATGSIIDASGANGGTILIGGDYQGGINADNNFHTDSIRTATSLTVETGAALHADGLADGLAGDGGNLVLWSDTHTRFAGLITARGGPTSGDGGFAEVSGKLTLDYKGTADMRATVGEFGTVLLDPTDYYINTTGTAPGGRSAISIADLESHLATANYIIQTAASGSQSGNIVIENELTWTNNSTLTLMAAEDIFINGAISATAGGLTINAGDNIITRAAIDVARFDLDQGVWVQVGTEMQEGSLPTFSATDFRINNGSFLRATSGEGTTAVPFLISDVYGLQGINGNQISLPLQYRLAGHIDASGTVGWNDGKGFAPVGTAAQPFTGGFDGAGYAISGLTVNRPAENHVGLFGYANGGTIQKVGVINGSVTGKTDVGGLIGYLDNGWLLQSYFNGTTTGTDGVGGLIGKAHISVIEKSYSSGTVNGSNSVGGLAGYNNSIILNSYSTASITGDERLGGLAGTNSGNVSYSYAAGAVSAGVNTGALFGNYTSGTLVGVYWDRLSTGQQTAAGDDTPISNIGVLVDMDAYFSTNYAGFNFGGDWFMIDGFFRPMGSWEYSTSISTTHQLQLVTIDLSADYTLANDIDFGPERVSNGMWNINGFVPLGFNHSGGSVAFSGSFDGDGHTISGLKVNFPVLPNIGLFGYNIGTIRNLGLLNVDVTGKASVGGLVGLNEGNIENAYTTGKVGTFSGSAGGLVGTNQGSANGGTIEHSNSTVNLVSGTFSNPGIGGLVGINRGFVIHSHAESTLVRTVGNLGGLVGVNDVGGSITNSNAVAFAKVGLNNVGGLAGINNGRISYSHVTGTVTGGNQVGGLAGRNTGWIENSQYSGEVLGNHTVGGLVGDNQGRIIQSHAMGGVVGRTEFSTYIGGVAGKNSKVSQNSFSGIITDTSYAGQVSGFEYVGGLVGANLASQSSVSFGSIATSHASGHVIGNARVGGLVGENSGQISLSHSTSVVDGMYGVGGLVGVDFDSGVIDRSYSIGSVSGINAVGGLVGSAGSGAHKIQYSYATGLVTATGTAGGLVGEIVNDDNFFLNTFFDKDTTGQLHAVGNIDATVSGVTALQSTDPSATNFAFNAASYSDQGWNLANDWTMIDGETRPFGRWEHTTTITNAHQLQLIGMNQGTLAQDYLLANDIDLGSALNNPSDMWKTANAGDSQFGFVPIGDAHNSFTGTLDGAGHVLAGLQIERLSTHNTGLFGVVSGGQLNNVAVSGGTVTGFNGVGGLVGFMGTTSAGVINNSYFQGNIEGGSLVGGLVGNMWSGSEVANSYATGAVSGRGGVGGLVGENVNGTVQSSYFSGYVIGSENVGGFIGGNFGTSVDNYWNIETTGHASGVGAGDASGMTGVTTTQLQTALPSGWDSDVWGIIPGISNPYFNWRFANGPSVISGTVSGVAGGNGALGVDVAVNGEFAGSTYTGANGYHYLALDPLDGPVLGWLNGTRHASADITERGNAVAMTAGGHATSLDFDAGWLRINTDASNLTSVHDGLLPAARGNLSNDKILYSYPEGEFALNSGVGYRVDATAGNFIIDRNLSLDASIRVVGAGNLTISSAGSLESLSAGTGLVVAAADSFINNAGADALSAPNGRWLVYADKPEGSTFGNLDSGNDALWNATFDSLRPEDVTAVGNRYIFSQQPTLTFTSTDATKTYGETVDLSGNFEVSGLLRGVSGAFTAGNINTAYTGAPVLTSPGSVATANVAGGPYGISVSAGTLLSDQGYAFEFVSDGKLTVNPADMTITVLDRNKTYGDLLIFGAVAGVDYSVDGLVNTDTITGMTFISAGNGQATGIGDYAIDVRAATGQGLDNYNTTYVSGTLTVNPATLAIKALDRSKIYGETLVFDGGEDVDYEISGRRNNDQFTGVMLSSAGADMTAGASNTPYDITIADLTSNADFDNYDVVMSNGNLLVHRAQLEVSIIDQSKTYGDQHTFANAAGVDYIVDGLVNNDTITGLTLASAGAATAADIGSYRIDVDGSIAGTGLSNYDISTNAGIFTVNRAALNIRAIDRTKTYGQTLIFDQGEGVDYEINGRRNNDQFAGIALFSAGADAAANASPAAYDIAVQGGTGFDNYIVTYRNGGLTVDKAELTITALGRTKFLGETVVFGSVEGVDANISGLVNGDLVNTFRVTSSGAAASANEGTHVIQSSDAAGVGLSNYTITYVDGQFTVLPVKSTDTPLPPNGNCTSTANCGNGPGDVGPGSGDGTGVAVNTDGYAAETAECDPLSREQANCLRLPHSDNQAALRNIRFVTGSAAGR